MKFTISSALLAAPLAAMLCALSTGCGDPNAFDEGVAKGAAQAQPFQLDSEQVNMNPTQLACGATNELWEAPVVGVAVGDRTVSRLLDKGRNLNFTDDISSDELGHQWPYTQVRGKFPLQVDQVISIRDGEDKDTKIVQARVGIRVADPCFDTPLYIVGVRKGQYHDDLPATLQYERSGDGWHLTKIVH
jgi:hypothetical protein